MLTGRRGLSISGSSQGSLPLRILTSLLEVALARISTLMSSLVCLASSTLGASHHNLRSPPLEEGGYCEQSLSVIVQPKNRIHSVIAPLQSALSFSIVSPSRNTEPGGTPYPQRML